MIAAFKNRLIDRLAVVATTCVALLLKPWKPALFIFVAWVGIVGVAHAQTTDLADVLYEDKYVTDEGVTFHKYVDSKGNTHGRVYDPDGNEIAWDDEAQHRPRVMGGRLAAELDDMSRDDTIVVKIALHDPEDASLDPPMEHGFLDVVGGVERLVVNNASRTLTEESRYHFPERLNAFDTRRALMAEKILEHTMDVVRTHGMNIDVADIEQYASTGRSMTLTMKKSELKKFVDSHGELIAAIDLPVEYVDEITSAMQATGANLAYSYQANPGADIGVYMTETSCPDPGSLTNYLVLDPGTGASKDHAKNVSGIIRAVSPGSFLYCKGGHVLPTVSDLLGTNGNPRIYAVTQSSGSLISNYGIGDRDVDNFVYNQRVLFMKSAGNEGARTGAITSPGRGPNAVTVGNYDHRTNAIASTSSYVDPNTKNAKPELVAPGVSITAGGHTMTGTSMASPHVAGIAANFMSARDFVRNRPALAKAQLMAAARTNVTGGADKAGVGGARYPDGMDNYSAMWWEGTNSSFNDFATNGVIYQYFAITAPTAPGDMVRVVLTWLNRGTWLYAHQDDASPLGADFDLAVYDPDGTLLRRSISSHNPYEIVEFGATKPGFYWLAITRYANRDTTARLEVAAWVHKPNRWGINVCGTVPPAPWCWMPPCNPLTGKCP